MLSRNFICNKHKYT